jgi:RNA polymerase sigma-70 factor (ECF subfamily)
MDEQKVLEKTPIELETIIKSAQQGKEEAWRELVVRYTKVIWNATGSFRFSFQEREDIVQDVFAKLLLHIKEYDPRRSGFATYLTVITKRLCIDKLRALQRRPELTLPPEILQALPQHQSDNNPSEEENEEFVDKLLNITSTPQERLVVKMFYLEQLSYEEISDITKQNFDWVKNTLHRFRLRLKKHMPEAV